MEDELRQKIRSLVQYEMSGFLESLDVEGERAFLEDLAKKIRALLPEHSCIHDGGGLVAFWDKHYLDTCYLCQALKNLDTDRKEINELRATIGQLEAKIEELESYKERALDAEHRLKANNLWQ